MRHIISILVENKFGVLARIAGMFSGRGFNIETLNVGTEVQYIRENDEWLYVKTDAHGEGWVASEYLSPG